MEITLELPENVYRNFHKIAEEKQRRVEDVIADRLKNNLSVETEDFEETVGTWSDDAVLALAKLQLPKETADRMSELSDRVQDGSITDSEERELEVYTELCQISALRKAYGIAEAVKRGLISSPDDLK